MVDKTMKCVRMSVVNLEVTTLDFAVNGKPSVIYVNNCVQISYGVYAITKFSRLCKESDKRSPRANYHLGRASLLQLENSTVFVDGELMSAEGITPRYMFFR